MSAKLFRQIQAVLLIAVVAGAEVHHAEQNVHFNVRLNDFAHATSGLEANNFHDQATRVAKQMEAMLATSDSKERVKDVALQMEAMMADPALQARSGRVAKHVEAFMADPYLQKLARNIDEQVKGMKGGLDNEEQMKRVTKQIEEAMADPKVQEQVKSVEEQMNTLLSDPTLLKHAEVIDTMKASSTSKEEAQASTGQMEALARQVEATMADPALNEQVERIAERVKVVLADPKIQDEAKNIAEQAVSMQGKPSEEQMEQIERHMDALMAKPSMRELGLRVAEQMEVIAMDPHMQDLAQRLAEPMQAMTASGAASPSGEAQYEDSNEWADSVVDKIVDNGLFNRALGSASSSQADLDQATVAKTGATAMQPKSSLRTLPSARSLPRVVNIPRTGKYSNFGPAAPMKRGETVVPKSLESIFAGEGVQKTLQFLTIGAAGAYLRPEFTNIMKPAMTAGAQTLMLQAMVPALVFKSLATVTFSMDLFAYIAFGALLSIFRFCSGWLISTGVYGTGDDRDIGVMRRSTAHMLSGMAPALSSFPFIGEFVGPAAVGYGALIDLPNKVWVLLILPILLRAWSPVKGGDATDSKAEDSEGGVSKLLKALGEPFNIAILGGLTMIATGTKMSALGFAGKAIMAMSDSVTPTLFLILGLKLNLQGSTPTLCATLLLLRHGLLALGMSALLAIAGTKISAGVALSLVIMSQSAVSVVSTGLINAATTSGVQGYSTDIGIDLCGYSFPFSTMLAAITCILGDVYVKNLPFIGVGYLAAAAAFGLKSLPDFQKGETWKELTASAFKDK